MPRTQVTRHRRTPSIEHLFKTFDHLTEPPPSKLRLEFVDQNFVAYGTKISGTESVAE